MVWGSSAIRQVYPMESNETSRHSFVIHIWLEEQAEANRSPKWRGDITHIFGNQRCYFEDLDDIRRFIEPYLESTQTT